MSDISILIAIWIFLCLIQLRNWLAYSLRMKCIRRDFAAYEDGPGYYEMMFDLRKWTFKQFYPSAKV